MSINNDSHTAFVLHTRLYRETSLLVDFFTAEHGRMSAVARGARRPKSMQKGLLQSFQPLLLQVAGKNELKTVCNVEAQSMAIRLTGQALFCGMYINELIMRLLHSGEPLPGVFKRYSEVIKALSCNQNIESTLRLFERDLLELLGYGLPLLHEAYSGDTIKADNFYYYEVEKGFVLQLTTDWQRQVYRGKSLIALAQGELQNKECLLDCKRLLRYVLSGFLGNKPLKSRELFLS